MKTTARSTKQVVSNVHALIGGILFAVGVIVFAIHFPLSNNEAILALRISGGTIALSGVIELIIAFFFRKAVRREQAKLERLQTEGLQFEGEITNIKRHLGVRYGRSFSVYAECTYTNREGHVCLVKSSSFLYGNESIFDVIPNANALAHDNYSAKVYVNPYDPTDYAVEIFTQQVVPQGVYDYR